jgi:hypothetical protein
MVYARVTNLPAESNKAKQRETIIAEHLTSMTKELLTVRLQSDNAFDKHVLSSLPERLQPRLDRVNLVGPICNIFLLQKHVPSL